MLFFEMELGTDCVYGPFYVAKKCGLRLFGVQLFLQICPKKLEDCFAPKNVVHDVGPATLATICSFTSFDVISCLHDQGMHGAFVVQVTVSAHSLNTQVEETQAKFETPTTV
jgi:hypothetical protein